MEDMKNFLENLFKNHSDTSTKYFWIYMCINFSFLINGIILIIIGIYPMSLNLNSNKYRIFMGGTFIAIWFLSLPQLS